jgi:predicted nucleic acid-binding protein
LIAGARGTPATVRSVFGLIMDPKRELVSSAFVRLEVLPKAVYHQRRTEVEFYRWVFDRVVAWAVLDDALAEHAEQEALRLGLSATDALHIASAIALNADELITSERPTKPLHRATGVRVVAL